MKNHIINGNFDIWQRGTSLAAATGKKRLADHWEYRAIGTTVAGSRQEFTPGQTDVPGEPAFFHRFVVSSSAGAGNLARMRQNIEDVRTFAGQTATLSFWAKADGSKNIALSLVQVFGDGSENVDIGVQQFSLTTSWQRFTATINIPSISGQPFPGGDDSLHVLLVQFWFDAGSDSNDSTNSLGQQSGTFDFAQIQFEKGSTATDFERRPVWVEMGLCRRYYQKRAFRVTTDTTVVGARSNSINAGVMQRDPDVTLTQDTGSGAAVTVIHEDLNGPLAGNDIYVIQTTAGDSDSVATVELDAELGSVS